MAISLLILLIPIASAINYTLNYSTIYQHDDSKIKIESDDLDTHDVKIFIEDGGVTVSEIYDEKWQAPFHYIIGAYPETKEFTIRTNYSGSANLCARLRRSGKTSYSEVCYPIIIAISRPSIKINDEDPIKNATVFQPGNSSLDTQEIRENYTNEKITLNKPSDIVTKEGQKEKIIIVGFASIAIALIVFLALKKL
ncbi:hypothetical protein KW787_00295 [Candidatus Pacearchaeota archaeon]|nr:hypothetical protein [Candidatus Pacearchaeota archaeon]